MRFGRGDGDDAVTPTWRGASLPEGPVVAATRWTARLERRGSPLGGQREDRLTRRVVRRVNARDAAAAGIATGEPTEVEVRAVVRARQPAPARGAHGGRTAAVANGPDAGGRVVGRVDHGGLAGSDGGVTHHGSRTLPARGGPVGGGRESGWLRSGCGPSAVPASFVERQPSEFTGARSRAGPERAGPQSCGAVRPSDHAHRSSSISSSGIVSRIQSWTACVSMRNAKSVPRHHAFRPNEVTPTMTFVSAG